MSRVKATVTTGFAAALLAAIPIGLLWRENDRLLRKLDRTETRVAALEQRLPAGDTPHRPVNAGPPAPFIYYADDGRFTERMQSSIQSRREAMQAVLNEAQRAEYSRMLDEDFAQVMALFPPAR
jgi:hypothetical protein